MRSSASLPAPPAWETRLSAPAPGEGEPHGTRHEAHQSFGPSARRRGEPWAEAPWRDKSAIPYCRHFLDHRVWTPLFGKKRVELKVAAARALGSIGGEESLRALKAHVQDRRPEVRLAVSQSIRRIAGAGGS